MQSLALKFSFSRNRAVTSSTFDSSYQGLLYLCVLFLSFSCSASHEELGDGSLPFSVQALQVEKAVADLVEGLMAWRDPEPNAGTRVSCLAPLCCLALAVPPLAAPEQVQFI